MVGSTVGVGVGVAVGVGVGVTVGLGVGFGLCPLFAHSGGDAYAVPVTVITAAEATQISRRRRIGQAASGARLTEPDDQVSVSPVLTVFEAVSAIES